MTYDDLMGVVMASEGDDWVRYEDEGLATYRHDIRIQITRLERHDTGEPFNEPWATQHPDPHASRVFYVLRFCGAAIMRFMLVSVDGGRAELPLPNAGTREVARERYALAKAVDFAGTLDEYMARSKLELPPA